ncbi:3080_t:CDS:1, partial [Cetraspora pellucida]
MKKKSILLSDLTQAIYNFLTSISEIDENLEDNIRFFFEYCVDFIKILDFQESDLSKSSIINKLIKNVQA